MFTLPTYQQISRFVLLLPMIIAAVFLYTLCIAMPSYQWFTIPDQSVIKWAAGLAAGAMAVCKLTFFPIASENFKIGKKFSAFILVSAALVAMAISIAASADLMGNLMGEHKQDTAKYIQKLSLMDEKIAAVDERIKIHKETTAQSISLLIEAKRIRGEGGSLESQKRADAVLANIIAERAALLDEKAQLIESAPLVTKGDFTKNIDFVLFGIHVFISAPMLASITLHVLCVLAVLATTAWFPEFKTVRRRKPQQAKVVKKSTVKKKPITKKPIRKKVSRKKAPVELKSVAKTEEVISKAAPKKEKTATVMINKKNGTTVH